MRSHLALRKVPVSQHSLECMSSRLTFTLGYEYMSAIHVVCVAKSAVHINIYVITWVVPLCYYNNHIRNQLTLVLFLIKTWHKRYLFVMDELINTYRLLFLDYHLFGINI